MELLSCQFCGSKGKQQIRFTPVHGNEYKTISCTDKQCPVYEAEFTKEQWNTRTLLDEVEQALAALDNLYDKAYRKLETNIDDIQQAGEALTACQHLRRK